uniref:Cystein rich protein n=1 Tax=Steinernema glaseri TaxID=37863 RepID=A0A1I8AJG0_9BILA
MRLKHSALFIFLLLKESSCLVRYTYLGANRFEASEGLETSEVHDYILATNADDKMCSADTTRNGIPLEKDLSAEYCRFVGFDIANCVSSKLTFFDLDCPAGEERVDVKKEKRLCCPVGEKLAEERDGKALCCPQKKELRDVVNGKAICCAPNENHKQGTTLCCPMGEKLAEERDGKALCCPQKKELKDVVDGKTVCCDPDENHEKGTSICCPTGESYSKLEDTERCCPNGTTLSKSANGDFGCCPKGGHFEKNEDGEAVCCGDGYVLKGFYKGGKKACCTANSTLYEDDGVCCSPGLIPSKAANEYTGCCKQGYNLYYASDDIYRCCFPDYNIDLETRSCVKL